MAKKVVVIGGGFAGSYLAKKLQNDFEVVLIDAKDYFEFTPGILRTIVEPKHIKKIQILHKTYLKKAEVVVEEVKEIAREWVKVKNKKIRFDYLAICSGSSYKSPIKEKNVVIAARAEQLMSCYERLCKSKKVLIIGGGLVGVELAGEIAWKYKDKNVTIVQAADRILERNNQRTIGHAVKFLQKHGVNIILNERVAKNKGKTYITNKGREVKCDMAFLCTGIKPNFGFMKKHFSKDLSGKNHIKLNNCLQLASHRNIFAAGDITGIKIEKTAQNAERQAKVVAENILRLENGEELTEYSSKKTPLVISLGKYNGIFTTGKITLGGLIPALMKALIEDWEMLKKRI